MEGVLRCTSIGHEEISQATSGQLMDGRVWRPRHRGKEEDDEEVAV